MFVTELISCISCGMFHVLRIASSCYNVIHVLRLASSCYDYHMVHIAFTIVGLFGGTLWVNHYRGSRFIAGQICICYYATVTYNYDVRSPHCEMVVYVTAASSESSSCYDYSKVHGSHSVPHPHTPTYMFTHLMFHCLEQK